MGILERTRHVVRADLNELIRKAKNPEAVLEAYLDDLQTVQEEAESLRAAELAEREIYASRLRDIQEAQNTWEKKAKACLERGDEDLARTALERKLDMGTELIESQRELEHRDGSLAVLESSIEALRTRIEEVARKRRELRFRRQVLQARSELQEAIGRVGRDGDETVLAEAEQELAAMESKIEAAEAMDGDDAEHWARRLESTERKKKRDKELDAQLARLKSEIKKAKKEGRG